VDVQGFLNSLQKDPDYKDQIVHIHTQPPCEAVFGDLPGGIHHGCKAFLESLGFSQIYQHQAEAIEALLNGENVILSSGTASGKSLCYQLPILETILNDSQATALMVFPAKALARDQATTWNKGVLSIPGLVEPRSLLAIPYDGDSNSADRRTAKDTARLLVSNPEMIHSNMIPGHGRWLRFMRGLRYIVLDEVHTYTGFFGANMANLLRRLQRICRHYGGNPQYVCCSATMGNPGQVAELLTGKPFRLIDRNTSASGSRTFVFWNPPRIKARQWRGRRSANVEAHELMTKLIMEKTPTICFSKARNTAEMVYRYVRESLQKQAPGLAEKVIPYRGGYSAEERREMEENLREGRLFGVSATRALELGIDIGMLEACIIIGYPGLLSAFMQQAGRAGRSQEDSLCILVGIDTPINQYIMQHPQYVFDRPIERVVIDRDNPFVVMGHMRCASAELPVTQDDVNLFGYAAPLILEVLEENKKIYRQDDEWYHTGKEAPAPEVRLRGYGDESTVITDVNTGRIIDRMDKFRAMRLFYDGAIYFHRGDTYAMIDHDTDRNLVTVKKVDVSYYTDPLTGTAVDHIDEILEERPLGTAKAYLGEVYAVLSTPLYEKVKFYTLDRISQHPTGLPSIAYEATAFWLTPPPELGEQVRRFDLNPEAGCRGILYCVSRVLPLFLTCDQNDFDWTLGARNSSWDTMFWFEFYLHGIGNSEQCFDRMEAILSTALEHLLTCDCDDGCPNCTSRLITPYHVRNIELGEGNMPTSRRGAVVILNCILNGASVQESVELLNTPREKRGQSNLPSIVDRPRLTEPNRLPLDDRTRNLLLRKLERSRHPKEELDHQINLEPELGAAAESENTLEQADAEMRSEHRSIRHAADPISRKLRRKLDGVRSGKPSDKEAKTGDSERKIREIEQNSKGSIQPHKDPIQAGDSIARRARLRRKKK
jgi:DEAD/DEAH box helicase domain-containing protein